MEENILQTIDFAATKSDRFLFVGLLLVGIIAASIIFKYLTSRLDQVEKKMEQVQVDFNTHLRTANKEMMEILSISNQAIGKNMLILDRIERKIETL
jgi:tetrahydromethanopterin S-methyltransferase subunit G